MNILTIVILAMFAVSVYLGYKKGFLKTAFSLVSWIMVFVLCDFAAPVVTDLLIQNTNVDAVIQTTIEAKVMEALEQAAQNSAVTDLEAALPAELKEMLLGEGENLLEVLTDVTGLDLTPVVNGVMGILGFVITVIGLRIAMLLVEHMLGGVEKLPLIGKLDKLLGLVCGGVKGLIWCWVILAVVSVLSLTGANAELAGYIAQSKLLTWLQDNNVLLNLIASIK